jgi:hypothetical protein
MNLFSKKSDIPRRRQVTDDAHVLNSPDAFKRNRTLTNNTISNSLDNSPRVHAHHLAKKRQKVFGVFIIVALLAAFLWLLVSNFTAVVVISTSDTAISKSLESSKYESVIQQYLSNNPLGRFQFFLDRGSLSSYVSSKLPEVSSVTQKNTTGVGITDFAIAMRIPVAGWKINDKQYYVDAQGVPFEQNYFATPTVQIIDNSGASLQTGAASVSKRFLGFVGQVVSLAKNSGYTVTQAILPAGTTRELEIRLKDNNLLVKLSIDRPAGEQIEDMSRAVQYFTSHAQMPTYIDVRVSGRAFFE